MCPCIYNADMHADPGSLRERLKSSTESAWRKYCALEVMLPYKEVGRGQPIKRQRLSASTIPWHGAVAELIHDFYTEVRRLEVGLIAQVTGAHGSRRGGSDANTRLALTSIEKFSHVVDDQTVLGILGYMDKWIRRVDSTFNPDRGLHRLPREPGEGELRCPWCKYQTMRWQPATGIIVCINPECYTDEKIRPRWQAEYEVVGEEMKFTWTPMDGEGA